MAWRNSHQRTRFLAALGDQEAALTALAAGLSIRPLNLEIARLRFWAPDDLWCEWKRHLQAAGRCASLALAVAVARETQGVYKEQMPGDRRLEALLDELEESVHRGRVPTQDEVRRHESAMRDFDSGVREPGIPYRARTALAAAIDASAMAVAATFTSTCRRSLWCSFLALAPPGCSADHEHEICDRMLTRARAALRSWGPSDTTPR